MTDAPKLIVCATDLSARGQRAVERAFVLAAAHTASLLVVHVVDDELPESLARLIRVEAAVLVEQQLEAARGAALGTDGVAADLRILRGRPAEALARLAEEESADLLVVGAHRADRLWELVQGATSQRLLALAPSPVLIARRGGDEAVAHILAAVDFSVASGSALATAATLYPNAQITVLHVFDLVKAAFVQGNSRRRYEEDVRRRAAAEMEALLARQGLAARVGERVLKSGNSAHVILAEAERKAADVIAFGTRGQTGLGALLVGSVAAAVIEGASADLLAVKSW